MNNLTKTILVLRSGNTGRKGGQYGNQNARKMTVKDWNNFDPNTSYEDWPRTSTGYPQSPPEYMTQEKIEKEAALGHYYSKQYKYVDEVTLPSPGYYKTEKEIPYAELLKLPKGTMLRAIHPFAKRGQGYGMKVESLILHESDNTLNKAKYDALLAQDDRLREAHWKVIGKPEPYKPLPTPPPHEDSVFKKFLDNLK